MQHFIKQKQPTLSVAYKTFWQFAARRQDIFFRRVQGQKAPFTDDPILLQYKFTNVYRACDRVSQYLISNIVYNNNLKNMATINAEDLFLRVILFKFFNKIETWEYLENYFDTINVKTFDVSTYKNALDKRLYQKTPIYSNAYLMAPGNKAFGTQYKHHAHLLLLEKMLTEGLPQKIATAKTMAEGYTLLREYPLIGHFLAYQYITDLNYTPLTDFSEMSFTTPGPGALDGIYKCFTDLGDFSTIDIIKWMAENQEDAFKAHGLTFQKIGQRPLQYIDIQNIFCEVSKYCRVAHPNLLGPAKRTKIKQTFKENPTPIVYTFPPKWGIQAL